MSELWEAEWRRALTRAAEALDLGFEGASGEAHGGLTRPSCGRRRSTTSMRPSALMRAVTAVRMGAGSWYTVCSTPSKSDSRARIRGAPAQLWSRPKHSRIWPPVFGTDHLAASPPGGVMSAGRLPPAKAASASACRTSRPRFVS